MPQARRPSPRLYARFVREVKARGLEVQAVAGELGVSRSHLYRALTDPTRQVSAALWSKIAPYLQKAS